MILTDLMGWRVLEWMFFTTFVNPKFYKHGGKEIYL